MPGLKVSESSAPTTTRKSGTINKQDSIDKNWISFDRQTWFAEKKCTGKRPQTVWGGRKPMHQIQATVAMEQYQVR